MAQDLDSLLDNVLSAKVSGSGVAVREGAYVLQVMDHLVVKARTGGQIFIFAEFKVIESKKINPAVEPNGLGTTCSVCFDLTSDSGPGNMKKYFCGLAGVDARAVEEKDPKFFDKGNKFDQMVKASIKTTPGQCPLAGMLIGGDTFVQEIKKGKNAGKPYVGLNWRTLEAENTPEKIQARKG